MLESLQVCGTADEIHSERYLMLFKVVLMTSQPLLFVWSYLFNFKVEVPLLF